MKFLDRDWCGFQWTGWIPLAESQDSFSKIPSEPGLYRVRFSGDKVLIHLGQTGSSLRERVRALASSILSEQMPSEDPPAFPCLWALRAEKGKEYETSAALYNGSREGRMAAERFLLWQYRMENGSSTLCDHGRFHPRSKRSKDIGQGVMGKHPGGVEMDIRGGESFPPLLPSGSLESHRWMGLEWSDWEELNLGNVQKMPTQPGVYRIYDSERQEMLLLGESGNLRMRVQGHSRSGWEVKAVFSYHLLPRSLPEHQRREIESDLIGGYYLERVEAPRFQFKK